MPTQVGAEGEAGDGGELGPGQADDAGGEAGQDEALVRERQQHQQQEEDAEGGRVGVGEDEVEGGAGEADRGDDQRSRSRPVTTLSRRRASSVEDGEIAAAWSRPKAKAVVKLAPKTAKAPPSA